ncbi:MAG TPA: T9SS type A sorting domain-containing protein [Agriterribacter sp.]|nr:T9SS type A sorting domain-containing protein [Agriterribacter sp.]
MNKKIKYSTKNMYKFAKGTRQIELNVDDLKAGTYFIEITSGQNKETQQLMIQK